MTTTFAIQLTNGTAEFDFLTGPTGNLFMHIASRVTTRHQTGLWEEQITLVGKGTQSLTVAAERTLGLIGSRVRNYDGDPNFVSDRYWLAEKAEGESLGRRALLYDLRVIPSDRSGMMRLQNFGMTFYEITLLRDEWESTAARTTITEADMAAGGKKTIPPEGTLPGRIARLRLEPASGIGTGASARTVHWIGIRPTYHGTTSFVAEWDWSVGTFGADTSQTGGTVSITFATETAMVPRVTLKLSDIIGSNHTHMIGEYNLVMSFAMSGGAPTQFAMQISGDGVEGEPHYSGSTASLNNALTVGTIRIPSAAIRDVTVGLADIEISLSAELISGTGTLTVTKVYAVPAKHFIYMEDSVLDSADSSGFVELWVHPEGEPLQVNSDGSVEQIGHARLVNWEIPVEGGVLVYVGGNADGGIGGDVDLELDIVNRWEGYRV